MSKLFLKERTKTNEKTTNEHKILYVNSGNIIFNIDLLKIYFL